MYTIVRINDVADLYRAKEFAITHYLWGSTYQPEVKGRFALVEGKGFHLQMTCREANPKRVYTAPNDPVYKDSCMEAFLNYNPSTPAPGYMNFEMNANGAMLCAIGANRYERPFLREFTDEIPAPTVQIHPDSWQLDLQIPLSLIYKLYGHLDFVSGYQLRGNFYKCGDETASRHYGSWNEVGAEMPNFHLPEYFGDLVIG